jgi:hypothetical protein
MWMRRAMIWKSKKGKSFMAAMMIFCAVSFGSGFRPQSLDPGLSQTLPNPHGTEVHVLAPRGGGSTAAKARSSAPRWVQKEKEVVKDVVVTAADSTSRTLKDAIVDLKKYMAGPKSDTLLLLLATALITPICKRLGTSPILGFLASGMLLGPNGCGLISGIHTTETLAELGIVFFLFEMGIELSVERLLSMKRDVFGLGLSQFLGTAIAVAGVGRLLGLPANALVVLGGGLALSSSAFVWQLDLEKHHLGCCYFRIWP